MNLKRCRLPLLIVLASCGLFFGTANPVVHIPFAVLLYPAALCAAARGDAPFRTGWLAGIPGASAALYWVACAAQHYGGFPWLLAAPCSILLGMYVSLWGGLFAWLLAHFPPMGLMRRSVAGGALWFLLEWARGWFCTGFPWLTLSSGLAAWPALIQPLCFAGAYGYSGILAAAAVFAEGGGRLIVEGKRRDGTMAVAAGTLLCLAAAMFGLCRMQWQKFDGEPVGIALIQGNVRQDLKWTPEYQSATLQKYMRLTMEALGGVKGRPDGSTGASPDIVIWPETAMPFYYPESPNVQDLRRFSAGLGIPLVTGIPALKHLPDGSRMLLNRACLFDAGNRESFYDKEHLVPFGEYIPPFMDIPLFEPLLQGLGGFAAGAGSPMFVIRPEGRSQISAGMLVCYEAVFPELARERAAGGAQILFNISNDAWYDKTSAALQHLHLSLMRAVEQGRWMARSTNTGITALMDPFGTVYSLGTCRNDYELFTDNWLAGTALALSGHTPYFYLHPWLPGLALLLLCGTLLSVRRRKTNETHKD